MQATLRAHEAAEAAHATFAAEQKKAYKAELDRQAEDDNRRKQAVSVERQDLEQP